MPLVDVRAMAHITGGGIPGNLPRVLPKGLGARLELASWPRPDVFDWLAGLGVEEDEMRRVFNLGLGYLVVVPAARGRRGHPHRGRCRALRLSRGRDRARRRRRAGLVTAVPLPVGVLVSGTGSNLQALLDELHPDVIEVVGVASSRADAPALERAAARRRSPGAVSTSPSIPTASRATPRWPRGCGRGARR